MITILIGVIAFIVGAVLSYFMQKANSVSRKDYDSAKAENGSLVNQLSTKDALVSERTSNLEKIETENIKFKEDIRTKESTIAELAANLRSKSESEEDLKEKVKLHEAKIEERNNSISELKAANLKFEAENKAIQEKLDTQKKEIEELGKKSLLEFESLANKIFDEKTTKFSKTSKENIEQVLSPLKENLKEFKKKVEDTYDKESKERFSLESKIKDLVELNQQISKDATNLTNALKGQAKTQGDWGEMILESILEHSGLVKNREYFTQESYKDDDGKRKQPDVIIKYPNDRHIIVDSKVSLTAYERFANCEDPEEQKLHLAEHIKSVKSHIDNLSSKEYDKIEKSLDFVMLFVPIEPAYMTVIHYDQHLWSYAYKKRILLISPTNLIAALKMVADIWIRENQNANAVEIAKRGELLYEKFVGFITDMEGIDKAINKASEKYGDAIDKLSKGRGNLIGQAESLKNMGLNPKKRIPDNYLIGNEEVKEIE